MHTTLLNNFIKVMHAIPWLRIEHAMLPLTGFLLLLLIVAMWERRFSRPYIASALGVATQISPYVTRMVADANATGLIFQSFFEHANPSAKIYGYIAFTADRTVLMITEAGTICRLHYKQTSLYSALQDGTFLWTTDLAGEPDLSGLFRLAIDWKALFAGLWKLHQKRIHNVGSAIIPFEQQNPIDLVNDLLDWHTQRLVQMGYAKYADATKTCWRYTFRGALRIRESFYIQLWRASRQIWRARSSGAGSAV